MKKKKRIIISALMLICAMTLICSADSQAASRKWKKACKAYNSFLAKNKSHFYVEEGDFYTENPESYKKTSAFNIVDLNKDGTPELLAWHDISYKNSKIYVYTYKNGKVKKVGKGISACNSAGGYLDVYICKKNHLHVHYHNYWIDVHEYRVYSIKNGKLKRASSPNNCKEKKNPYLYSNTKKNRKRYLK